MSRLDDVLDLLAAGGPVTGNMRQSAQSALDAVPDGEPIVGAYRCGIVAGASRNEGVAVFTPALLSVFDRRGLRSLDQELRLPLTRPFTVGTGASPTQVQILVPGRPPVTLELLEQGPAEAFRKQLGAESVAEAWGWWSAPWVHWPGWLDARASWTYLGGDPTISLPVAGVRVHVGPRGVALIAADGSSAPLAGWRGIAGLEVEPSACARVRAARGRAATAAFARAWEQAAEAAVLVLRYTTGDEVFLATSGLDHSQLEARLWPVLAAFVPPEPEGDPQPGRADAPTVNG